MGETALQPGGQWPLGGPPADGMVHMDMIDGGLQAALAAAGIGIWRYDRLSRVASWDAATSLLFGHAKRPGMADPSQIVHPDDLAMVEAELDECYRTQIQRSMDFRVRHPDGSIRWLRAALHPGFEDQSRADLVGIISDVTEQRGAEEEALAARAEARRTAQRLRAVLESTTDCVCVLDRDWRVTYVNGRAEKEVARGRDLVGQVFWEMFPETVDGPFGETYRSVMADRMPRSVEAYFAPFEDWYEVHAAPIDEGISVFFRNVGARKRAEEIARFSDQRFRRILDAVPQMSWSSQANGTADYFSPKWIEAFGEVDQNSPADVARLFHPNDQPRVWDAWERSLLTGEPHISEHRLRHRDGSYRWMLVHVHPEREHGRIIRWYGSCTDIHDRRVAEEALRESEERLRLAVEATGLGIADIDMATFRHRWSATFRKILGISDGPVASYARFVECVHPDDRQRMADAARLSTLKERGDFEDLLRIIRADNGELRWIARKTRCTTDGAGNIARAIVTIRDVTEQQSSEHRMLWTATHDSLTGLHNRASFHERLDRTIAHASAEHKSAALLLLDVDHFKLLNDSLGHDAGDALLRTFADRLMASVRPSDTVARLGGDEFAIILGDIGGASDVAAAVASIFGRLREPFTHGDRLLDCAASVGASVYPVDASDAEDLLKCADIALYTAKASGRGQLMLFEPRMRSEMQRHASMINIAREALLADQIVPYYQPKVELGTGRLIGFEALLRWQRPGGDVELPETIAAAFEDAGLAAAIGDRMLQCVTNDMRAWLDRSVDFGRVAFNAAAAEFRHDNVAEKILAGLARARIDARFFELEVTETVFLGRGAEYVGRALSVLHAAGISIALDDFGTGYASLSHLKQFPVDIIKIDRSFVRTLEADSGDAAIIHAVINLGQSLGIRIVAEGIETQEQARLLIAKGCHYGQGFLFGKAEPAASVPDIIEKFRCGSGAG